MIPFSEAKTILAALAETAKRNQHIEAMEYALQIREIVLDAYGEIAEAGARIRELESKLNERAAVTMREGRFWKRETDGSETGPYCPNCYPLIGKLIIMRKSSQRNSFLCPNCNNWI